MADPAGLHHHRVVAQKRGGLPFIDWASYLRLWGAWQCCALPTMEWVTERSVGTALQRVTRRDTSHLESIVEGVRQHPV